MDHPFRVDWWTKRRTVALVLVLLVTWPTGASTDPASFVGEVIGAVLVVYLGVLLAGAASHIHTRLTARSGDTA